MTVKVDGPFSCPFALNTIRAMNSGGLDHVYSPTTHTSYAMTCQSGGAGGGPIRASCVKVGEETGGTINAMDLSTYNRR